MTRAFEPHERPADVEDVKHEPIDVRIAETVEQHRTTVTSVYSYILLGTEAPFQLIPHSDKRSRTVITYAVALGGNGTAYAYLTKRDSAAQAARGITTAAFVLQTVSFGMATFIYEGATELWCAPQAASAPLLISVLDEWYKDAH